MFPVTSFYAALAAFALVALSARVILRRMKHRVGLGDGGVDDLQRAVRIQGNFSEYIPFALFIMALLEANHISALLLNLLGIALLAGRGFHFLALAPDNGKLLLRQIGMVMTFGVLIIEALILLGCSLT